jgi:hypothetical protein
MLCVSARAQGPAPPLRGAPVGPAGQRPASRVTQGQLAVALATRLGLGDNLKEERAIRLLAGHGIVPETGWNRQGPATDIFLVEIQKTILSVLSEVARHLGIPAPPTLSLMISTPGHMGGQTFAARSGDVGARQGGSSAVEAERDRGGETAPAAIETPHPYPIGDDQLPVVWSYRLRVPAARFIKLHLARIELSPSDSIRLLDGYGQERWTRAGGNPQTTDVWSNAVDGDTAIILIHAGSASPGWGFTIDRYRYSTR